MGVKLIAGVGIFLVIGLIWLRMQWGRSKNRNASTQMISDLQSGKHMIESYSDALSIMIFSKPVKGEINTGKVKQYLNSLAGKKILEKYSVQYGDMDGNSKGIVIGEGAIKDIIHDRQVDVFYPCWLFIDANRESGTISFRSTFPENKDHHYLLEDLSTEIYNQCINNKNGSEQQF